MGKDITTSHKARKAKLNNFYFLFLIKNALNDFLLLPEKKKIEKLPWVVGCLGWFGWVLLMGFLYSFKQFDKFEDPFNGFLYLDLFMAVVFVRQ